MSIVLSKQNLDKMKKQSETNLKSIVQKYAEAQNRHDVDFCVAGFVPDRYYQAIGFGEPVKGAEALRQFFSELFKSMPDYHTEFSALAEDGNTVAATGSFGGTLMGQFMGQPVTPGQKLDVPVTYICTFNDDGLLLNEVGYFDTLTMLHQAGLPVPLSNEKQKFLQDFKSFWAKPSGARVRDLFEPNATVDFSGQGVVSGEEYVGLMDNILAGVESLKVDVVDYAQRGDTLFIFWNATRVVEGKQTSWHGVDRFVIKNGMTVEEQVIFDTQLLNG